MDSSANVGYLRQQRVLSRRISMGSHLGSLYSGHSINACLSPAHPPPGTPQTLHTVTDWYRAPPLPAQGSMSQWQSEGAIARVHFSLKNSD